MYKMCLSIHSFIHTFAYCNYTFCSRYNIWWLSLYHSLFLRQLRMHYLIIDTPFSCCSAENVYCVTPTATSCSSCPHTSANCATLAKYAHKIYFIPNITTMFLPGDHTLDTDITVSDVARLTMHAWNISLHNAATVVRNGPVNLL